MNPLLLVSLDIALMLLLVPGILFALRLSRQIKELRATRMDMERMIGVFNATVAKADASVQGLKNTTRNAGDDLEKLIDRATTLRDELHFLTESADQIASRIAGGTLRNETETATSVLPKPSASKSQNARRAPVQADRSSPDEAVARVRDVLAFVEQGLKKEPPKKSAPPSPKKDTTDYLHASESEKDLLRALARIR